MTTTAPTSPSTTLDKSDLPKLTINTIRTLAMDAVQLANSGHPGAVMGLAPTAYTLWSQFLRFDPNDPIWPNRDRFVLSAGHASMLLYSLLHLTGVKSVNPKYEILNTPAVPLDEIKKFRQLDSKCPGHPEYRWTSGVETTTGPLGQGFATSVGMAIAGKWMAVRYNKPGFEMFNYNVYAIGGDGCMMEGVASEAASLAAHLKLNNLCWFYDSNGITIEGKTALAFSEDVGARFKAYGWNVISVADANDLPAIQNAIKQFQQSSGGGDKPTLIIIHSHIGYGSPVADSHKAHGEPLGADNVKATKRFYGWPEDAQFLVPPEVPAHFAATLGKRGGDARNAWMATFEKYKAAHPGLADELYRMQHRQLPEGWDKDLPTFPADKKGIASRESSGKVLNAVAKNVPWLIGGAADLDPSTKTRLTFEGAGDFSASNYGGRNFHYGVREFAMGAVINGMALSKVRPYGSGFLIFSDYGRGAIRLAAIMEVPVIYIFTHDSIGVGEDGPTHQPVEQIPSLRAIPGMTAIRPCDANEVTEAWRTIMPMKHHPVCLILSRQALPTLDRSVYAPASNLAKGAYVLACNAPDGKPEVILIGTGSEVSICVDAYEALKKEGIKARVVSMPSWELFDHQDQSYRDTVLPPSCKARVAVEQASTLGWHRWVGNTGEVIGMHTFGASAPLKDVIRKFGFNPDRIVAAAKDQIAKNK
ncbi:MAG: transketolase [Phycisphaerae bacterium]